MLIQPLNRTDADRVLVVYKNVDGSGSVTTGMGVALCAAGNSIDGVSAVKNTAAGIKGFLGIAVADVPINGYGLATAYGYAASVLISNVGTSITVTAGDTLLPGAVAGTWFSSITPQAMSTLLYKTVYAADSQTISAQAWCQGIVRAM